MTPDAGTAAPPSTSPKLTVRCQFCLTWNRLDASRVAGTRSRGMRVVFDEGQIEVDFISRKVRNTTPRALNPLDFNDPLGASVADFVAAVRGTCKTLVRPEEARNALETALMIEESADHTVVDLETGRAYAHAAAR